MRGAWWRSGASRTTLLGAAPVAWETPEGNGLANGQMASAETEKAIDEQVQRITQDAYVRCKELLTENKALMDELTEKLISEETVDYEDLAKMRDAHFAKRGAVAA